jgi:hypothetical protein
MKYIKQTIKLQLTVRSEHLWMLTSPLLSIHTSPFLLHAYPTIGITADASIIVIGGDASAGIIIVTGFDASVRTASVNVLRVIITTTISMYSSRIISGMIPRGAHFFTIVRTEY